MSNKRQASISIEDLARLTGNDPDELRRAIPDQQQQSAEVVPFPIHRQRTIIESALLTATKVKDGKGDDYLRVVIERHRKHLKKIGVSADRIAREVRDLEAMLLGTGSEEKARA